jgi:hypothetical protein
MSKLCYLQYVSILYPVHNDLLIQTPGMDIFSLFKFPGLHEGMEHPWCIHLRFLEKSGNVIAKSRMLSCSVPNPDRWTKMIRVLVMILVYPSNMNKEGGLVWSRWWKCRPERTKKTFPWGYTAVALWPFTGPVGPGSPSCFFYFLSCICSLGCLHGIRNLKSRIYFLCFDISIFFLQCSSLSLFVPMVCSTHNHAYYTRCFCWVTTLVT